MLVSVSVWDIHVHCSARGLKAGARVAMATSLDYMLVSHLLSSLSQLIYVGGAFVALIEQNVILEELGQGSHKVGTSLRSEYDYKLNWNCE